MRKPWLIVGLLIIGGGLGAIFNWIVFAGDVEPPKPAEVLLQLKNHDLDASAVAAFVAVSPDTVATQPIRMSDGWFIRLSTPDIEAWYTALKAKADAAGIHGRMEPGSHAGHFEARDF